MIIQKQLSCPHCNNSHLVKNGKKNNGSQNYMCRGCNKQFIDEYMYWGADKSKQDMALKMMMRGSGIRDCSKVLGISTGAVLSCITRNAKDIEIAPSKKEYNKVQIDEQWSYVGNKKKSVANLRLQS